MWARAAAVCGLLGVALVAWLLLQPAPAPGPDGGPGATDSAERWQAAMPFPEQAVAPGAGAAGGERGGGPAGRLGEGDGSAAEGAGVSRFAVPDGLPLEAPGAQGADPFAGRPPRRLEGRVRFPDRTPAVGARATVAYAGREASVEADAEGRFALDWYAGLVAPFSLESGVGVDLHLADWGAEEGAREFELGRSAQLFGRLSPRPREPGGRVLLLRRSDRPSSSWERSTSELNAEGQFLFTDLDPGEFSVTAVALDRGAPLVAGIVLALGERRELVLNTTELLRLEGSVRTAAGVPVPGVELDLRTDGRNWPRAAEQLFERAAVSDADGSFRFEGLLPGRARLTWRTARGQTGRERFEVGALEALDVVVPGSAALSGFVRTSSGAPVAGAEVVVLAASNRGLARRAFSSGEGPAIARATSDAAGAFRVPEAPEGEALLVAARKGAGALGALRIGALADEELRELELPLVLSDAVALTGRVVDVEGAGLAAELDVFCVLAGIELECSVTVADADGSFALESVPAGSLRVRAAASGHLAHKQPVETPLVGELSIELEPELGLSGRVVLESGAAPRRCAVLLREPDGGETVRVVGTDAFGGFEMDALRPGAYELDVSGEDLRLSRGVPLAVELRPGERESGLLLEVERLSRELPASFVGEVWSRTAERLEGLKLSGVGRGSVVSSDGHLFEVSGVEPGAYRLRISAEGHGAVELGRFEPVAGQRIDLGAIELRAGARVEVVVQTRGSAGKRFRPRVRLSPLGVSAGGPGEEVIAVELERGAEGTYVSEAVLPGRWRLKVDAEGWAASQRLVEVRGDGQDRFEVTLAKAR